MPAVTTTPSCRGEATSDSVPLVSPASRSLVDDAPLVIFDCDGVLVDSETLVAGIESQLLREVGIELTPMEVATHFVGLSEPDMHRMIKDEWGVNLSEEFQLRKTAAIHHAFETSLEPVAGMPELLARSPHARCVASSATPERIRQSLTRVGLVHRFDRCFSAREVEHGKPAPDLFLHAAASLGVDPDRCLVVEDSPAGVAAGVAAGMYVIGFTAGSHCLPDHGDALRERGAAHVAGNAVELADHLDQIASS